MLIRCSRELLAAFFTTGTEIRAPGGGVMKITKGVGIGTELTAVEDRREEGYVNVHFRGLPDELVECEYEIIAETEKDKP